MLRPQCEPVIGPGPVAGRCTTGRRCGWASRAGTLTILRRMVAPRGPRGRAEDVGGASRLWVIVAHRTHVVRAETARGQVRQGSVDQVGEHGFDDRVAAVGEVGGHDGSVLLVKNGW